MKCSAPGVLPIDSTLMCEASPTQEVISRKLVETKRRMAQRIITKRIFKSLPFCCYIMSVFPTREIAKERLLVLGIHLKALQVRCFVKENLNSSLWE